MSDIVAVLVGAGGHARVLLDSLRQAGGVRIYGCLDADWGRWGGTWEGVRVLGGDDLLPRLAADGVTHFIVGVAGAGVSPMRRALFDRAKAAGLQPAGVRHPAAVVSPGAEVRAGAQLLPACVVNVGAVVGENAIVNTGAIVEHECVLDADVHVATGARLAGGVRIGAGSFIGAGSVVRQGIVIGAGALVGAGAVVVKDVAAGSTVFGVPARPRGRL